MVDSSLTLALGRIMLVHSIWSGILPDGVMNSVKLAILTIAMLWDILMSEEKISGKKIIGPHQPGLLFVYLGVVTWTVAQVVYAKTGKDVAFLEWEPVLLFAFLSLGIPGFLFLLLMEIKTKL